MRLRRIIVSSSKVDASDYLGLFTLIILKTGTFRLD
jgi:hypothetical protein